MFFADDIFLLSGSITHLQYMLNICSENGIEVDIQFNQSKCFLFQVELCDDYVLPDLCLCGVALQWVKGLVFWVMVGLW